MSLFTGIENAIKANTAQLKRIADFLATSSEPDIDPALGEQLTKARDDLATSTDALQSAVDTNTST